jgi:hypothetical protein
MEDCVSIVWDTKIVWDSVDDALSRRMKVVHLEAVRTNESNIKERVKTAEETYAFFKTVTSYLKKYPIGLRYGGYDMLNDVLLTYKGRLYIPNCEDLKRFIMDDLHKTPYTSDPGYHKMIKAIGKLFYWPRLKNDIDDYLYKCLECHKVKAYHRHPAGML